MDSNVVDVRPSVVVRDEVAPRVADQLTVDLRADGPALTSSQQVRVSAGLGAIAAASCEPLQDRQWRMNERRVAHALHVGGPFLVAPWAVADDFHEVNDAHEGVTSRSG